MSQSTYLGEWWRNPTAGYWPGNCYPPREDNECSQFETLACWTKPPSNPRGYTLQHVTAINETHTVILNTLHSGFFNDCFFLEGLEITLILLDKNVPVSRPSPKNIYNHNTRTMTLTIALPLIHILHELYRMYLASQLKVFPLVLIWDVKSFGSTIIFFIQRKLLHLLFTVSNANECHWTNNLTYKIWITAIVLYRHTKMYFFHLSFFVPVLFSCLPNLTPASKQSEEGRKTCRQQCEWIEATWSPTHG